MSKYSLKKIDDYRWEIPKTGGMRVPGLLYADEKMLKVVQQDNTPLQVMNVAHLPGIVKYSLAMPDMHWGYGFCVGGVAATDPEKGGVISPGGIGYDINCLSPDTSILHPLGYTLRIKDFEKLWLNESVNCFDFEEGNLTSTKIVNLLKRLPENKVYKITTKTGKTVIATEDHPFYTKDGMVILKKLKVGDEVAIYPFEGVPYEKPSDEIILKEEKVRELLLKLGKGFTGNGLNQIISHLKKRKLLPLRYDSPQLPYILKVMGYIFGDGNVHFVKKRGKGVTSFYGKSEDLAEIKKDISFIGYNCSRVYRRKRHHKINTFYGQYEFSNEEASCKVMSSSFAILLVSLGAPLGRKTEQNYRLPSWIFKAPLWQKRLFLAAFFGAEINLEGGNPSPLNGLVGKADPRSARASKACSPQSCIYNDTTSKTMSNHNYNFYCPTISIDKKEGFIESGRKFLEEISSLSEEFGVKTKKISQRTEYVNKEGEISYRLRLILSSETQSLINLYGKVGFEYNKKRRFLANVAVQFLKQKQLIIEKRKEAAIQAVELSKTAAAGAKTIYRQINSPHVNLRFIQRSIYEGRKTSPRINFNFLSFDRFLKKYTEGLGNSGMLWDEIISKQPVDFTGFVYDFTVEHPHHNFIANNFVVSNCGVRLVRTNLTLPDIQDKMKILLAALFNNIPCGVGGTSSLNLTFHELKKVLRDGAKWAVKNGYGTEDDIERTEEYGTMQGADPEKVSERALRRGKDQLGTLGSGNHFLEIDLVEKIYLPDVASVFGLEEGQIAVLIHSGSRGLGYQICDDYLARMRRTVEKYHISLPDRQLSCAPISSAEGKDYFAAMACAANYAWANRQIMTYWLRETFQKALRLSPKELGMELVYDVCHNIGKFEEHLVNGEKRTLFVHRKGATRAFPAHHPLLPGVYQSVGQPVLVPGDMGTNSYVMVGTDLAMKETWGSTCHGAGRVMSRSKAKKAAKGRAVERELEDKGILIMAKGKGTIAEEMPDAYKDIDQVVRIVEKAGLSRRVAKLRPLGVIKG